MEHDLFRQRLATEMWELDTQRRWAKAADDTAHEAYCRGQQNALARCLLWLEGEGRSDAMSQDDHWNYPSDSDLAQDSLEKTILPPRHRVINLNYRISQCWIGKTVAAIHLDDQEVPTERLDMREVLTLVFTDGTSLRLTKDWYGTGTCYITEQEN